ncbi:MAG TPA: VIT1/CCC1 transporter family protein [Chloroflexota bacterium]|nr:VIT1/CCC1 transporter family protein [Chloroflexota bacterium]
MTSPGRAEEVHRHPSDLIGSVILGLNDGIVTTLVFVLSVAAVSGSGRHAVVVAGLAEMLAGGVSMFLGGYSAARAVKEAYLYQVEVERHEIREEPEEERAEVSRMYRDKGFGGALLEQIVRHVTSDPERWLHVMVRDELGRPPEEQSASWQAGVAIGMSFMAGALVPLIAFLVGVPQPRWTAVILSICALVVTGAARSRFSRKTWLRGAGEMVAIGLLGTLAGYLIGTVLAVAF